MNLHHLELLSVISLISFGIIGAFDGLYFHLLKFKLHLHEETKLEHTIHGIRGLIFAPIVFIFFVLDSKGVILLLGLTLLVIDLVLEVFDIMVEKEARAKLGGISSGETLCHVFATSFRLLALGFIISTKPMDAFTNFEVTVPSFQTQALLLVGMVFSTFSLMGGILHFKPLRKFQHTFT